MGILDFFKTPQRPVPFSAGKPEVKGVELSLSDGDNFQTNMVTFRTVQYVGSSSSSYAMMYRRQPAVKAVVDFLARNIGQLNPKVYVRAGNSDRIEVGDHPLALLLHNPNPATTRFALLRDTVTDVAVFGWACWRKIRLNRNYFIVRLPPGALSRETEGGVTRYRLPNGELITRSELVIFSGYSPEGGEEGVSALETLRQVLQEEAQAVQARAAQWMNGPRPSGFIERPVDAPDWSDTARARFREEFDEAYAGTRNAGTVPVLEEGMKFVGGPSFSARDSDYIAGRRLTYEEVAIAYGVPPVIIGMGSETKSNAESFHRQVYQDVLGPWLRMLQDEIELQLLPWLEPLGEQSVYVEFNLKEKLKGSFEEEQRAITTAVGVPHMTVNEGRARGNFPRIDEPWADLPVQPLNVLYGGQPAVTVPTEDPGTRSAGFEVKSAPQPPAAALRRREKAAAEHEELLRGFFARQAKALTSTKADVDRDRWDRELTADLFLLATQTSRLSGQLAAKQINGVFNERETLAWLVENSRVAAESINSQTFDAVRDALDAEDVRKVFEDAQENRAPQLAASRSTLLVNFARTEAAKQSTAADGRQRMKTWVVTSRKSRHPELNGKTVPSGDVFPNGMAFPGDWSGGVDAVAGCQCLLQLS